MTEKHIAYLYPWVQYVPIIATALLFIVIVVAMVRIFRRTDNDIQWVDLISVMTQNGTQKADWNQIGKGGGVILCIALPFLYVYSPKMEAMGLAAIMGVALAYLGGVSAYAATLRSKQGSVETITTTEAAPATRTTETRVETPPIEGSKGETS